MIKKIERPDWMKMWARPGKFTNSYDEWFDENIKPFNDALESAVEVNCAKFSDDWNCSEYILPTDEWTHKALLINIEPIKQETAEDVLRELVAKSYPTFGNDTMAADKDLWDRAKAVLESEK